MGAARKLKRAARSKTKTNPKVKRKGPTTRGKAARAATTATPQATTRAKRIAGHQRASQARTQAKRDGR
jgi:hypothetical protein